MTLFFFDDFETDDFSLWDTDGSGADLFTSAASALAGSFGCEVATGCVGCGEQVILDLTGFATSTPLRIGWKFDRNDITFTSAQFITLIEMTPFTFSSIVDVRVINDGGVFKIQAVCIDDSAVEHIAESSISLGVKDVEVRLVSATTAVSTDGSIEIYVDGSLIDTASNIDNFSKFQDLGGGDIQIAPNQSNGDASSGSMYVDNFTLRDDDTPIFPPVSTSKYTVAPMRKPCDIDSDGSFLYIAALNDNGFPVLIKISSDLSADGALVFEPSAGTDIGIQCGRFDSGVVYIAGDFGGTNVVEKSSNSGSSFSVIDPATFGTIESFIVGPDSDDRILVSDVTNDDIQESIDSGTVWVSKNTSVGFNILAMARLDRNVQEMVLGAESAATLNINYTVNSGVDTEDIGTSPFPESDVNGVIVN